MFMDSLNLPLTFLYQIERKVNNLFLQKTSFISYFLASRASPIAAKQPGKSHAQQWRELEDRTTAIMKQLLPD